MEAYVCCFCAKAYIPRTKPRTANTYCSSSCSAKANNTKRKRKHKRVTHCPVCGLVKNNFSKYCSSKCQRIRTRNSRIESWLQGTYRIGNSVPNFVKAYLLEKQNNKCSICNIPNVWNGKPLVLICDHINGDSSNNAVTNLRMICSNCDSQLPTYKGRNAGNGRHCRRQRYKQGKSY